MATKPWSGCSRPLHKNDNCFVEQKNYSVVRRFVGYARYDTEAELVVFNELYALLSPYVNFFLPSQKLQQKIRQGSQVTKRYDRAQTPYRRLLDSAQLSKRAKAELRRRFRTLNSAQLHREIVRLQQQLAALQGGKRRGVEGAGSDGKAQGGFPTAPWETPRKEFPPYGEYPILRKGFRHFFRGDTIQLSGTFLVDATG